jgi:quinolinate synthase
MRMNTLAALSAVCQSVGTPTGEAALESFKPRPYLEKMPNGQTVAQAGCVPILHMRGFQQSKELPPNLVQDILTRNTA